MTIDKITTPRSTLLVTATRVTRNEEARVERRVADKQLVGVSVVCTHTVPQSIGASSLPIVPSGRYGLVDSSLEVGLVSSLVIDEEDFCELIKRKHIYIYKRLVVDELIKGLIILYFIFTAQPNKCKDTRHERVSQPGPRYVLIDTIAEFILEMNYPSRRIIRQTCSSSLV